MSHKHASHHQSEGGHFKGQSWSEREPNSAQLSNDATAAAVKALISTIRGYDNVSGAEHKKGTVFVRMADAVGSFFPLDLEGNPTLSEHPHHTTQPPGSIGEMKKRFDRLANGMSNDVYMQDICRAAGDAAVNAAREHMQENGQKR